MFKIFDFKKGKEMEKDKIKELEDKIVKNDERLAELQSAHNIAVRSAKEAYDKEINSINKSYQESKEIVIKERNELKKELLDIKKKQRDIEKDDLQNAYDVYMNAKKAYEKKCEEYNKKNIYTDNDTKITFDFTDLAKTLDELIDMYSK